MSRRILVVDDSPTQLDALQALLSREGLDLTAARTGEEALAEVRRGGIDLVVSDVVMPGMTGYELCRRIKDEAGAAAAPAVILLTSLADPRDIVRGLESGADSYATKPYDPEQLVQRVWRVLDNRELRRDPDEGDGVRVRFLGELYTIRSDPPRILELLLSTFEDLIRSNRALRESERALRNAHARELEQEQAARERAERDNRRLEELKRRAEHLARARDEVLAAVSHDLRNPLGTIYTSAALLLEVPLAEDAVRRQLEIIRRTAERMNRLIQDLLDVARIEAGFFTVEPVAEPAESILREVVEQFTPMAEQKGVRLEQRVDAVALQVQADRGRIVQVMSNLVSNALKFTPEAGCIRLSVAAEEDAAQFSVADTGPGIEAASLPHIFDRFWQGGGATAGAGLGLAIAKGIVEAHGGRIWAEVVQAEGESGATFHFTLPRATARQGTS